MSEIDLEYEAAKRKVIALRTATALDDPIIDLKHVALACDMCEAMALDPNGQLMEDGFETNWWMMMPAAAVAYQQLKPESEEEDDIIG
jgi:hypothetical protein